MNQLTISPNWTDQERLQVINRLSLKLVHLKRGFVMADHVGDIGQVINLVSGASAAFLELNRDNILRELENEPA